MTQAIGAEPPLPLREAPPCCGKFIAIASGKGGVGKTWLAISLSQAFARAGRRALLFDGDLGLANVDIQLGLAPERDLGGVLAARYGLKRAATAFADGGFDIIAGRSGSGTLASLAPPRLVALGDELEALAADYQDVVLDLGAGVDRTVRHLAARSGRCLVVLSDEPTSLTDAYAFIKLLLQQRPGADIRVVVNLAEGESAGRATYETLVKACESFLKARPPLGGIIRRDSKVKDSIRSQTPILTRFPTCPAAQDVEKLAQGLLRER